MPGAIAARRRRTWPGPARHASEGRQCVALRMVTRNHGGAAAIAAGMESTGMNGSNSSRNRMQRLIWGPRLPTPPPGPVAKWKPILGGLSGILLLVLWIFALRGLGLPPALLREWGELLVLAPFVIAAVVIVY